MNRSKANENIQIKNMKELFKDKINIKYLSFCSIITFIISNLLIFYIFKSFFNFSEGYIAYFIFSIGTVISFILIKTNYIIKVTKNKEVKGKRLENLDKNNINLGGRNLFLILIRLLFFNILNDLFMVLVIWSFIFGIASIFKIVSINKIQFGYLLNIISIIGILSGIFQFYISNYKKEISEKIVNSLAQYYTEIKKKITFNDFLEYLKVNDSAFYKKVDEKIDSKISQRLGKIFEQIRAGNMVTNITINTETQNDIILSDSIKFKDEEENKKLKKHYEKFFIEKDKEIKEDVKRMDLSEFQRILLPNINFFDEVIVQLVKTNYELESKFNKNPETYKDYLTEILTDNMFLLVNRILNIKDKESLT